MNWQDILTVVIVLASLGGLIRALRREAKAEKDCAACSSHSVKHSVKFKTLQQK